MTVTRGVYAIVMDPATSEVLLLHRKLHWSGWEFIKGGVGNGEKPTDAVRREVLEETGITVIQTINLHCPLIFQDRETERQFESFLVLSSKQKVQIGPEHDDAQWVTVPEARKKVTHRNTLPMLEAAVYKLSHL